MKESIGDSNNFRPDDPEVASDAQLAEQINHERKKGLEKLYGVTEKNLEKAADDFLKAHGFDDLGEKI